MFIFFFHHGRSLNRLDRDVKILSDPDEIIQNYIFLDRLIVLNQLTRDNYTIFHRV